MRNKIGIAFFIIGGLLVLPFVPWLAFFILAGPQGSHKNWASQQASDLFPSDIILLGIAGVFCIGIGYFLVIALGDNKTTYSPPPKARVNVKGEYSIGQLAMKLEWSNRQLPAEAAGILAKHIDAELNVMLQAVTRPSSFRGIRFSLTSIRQGSVLIDWAIFVAVVGNVASILKDYDGMRKGLNAFTQDLNSIRQRLQSRVVGLPPDAEMTLRLTLESAEELRMRLNGHNNPAEGSRIQERERLMYEPSDHVDRAMSAKRDRSAGL
jgi:hypothetical protein